MALLVGWLIHSSGPILHSPLYLYMLIPAGYIIPSFHTPSLKLLLVFTHSRGFLFS